MTLRLHYAPATCSLAAMIGLEAVGAPYERCLVNLATDRGKLADISPTGKIPALEIGAGVLTETAAILYWLHRSTPGAGLLPEDGDDLAWALADMGWLSSTLHIVRRQFAVPRAFTPDPSAQEALQRTAAVRYPQALERLDGWVGGGRFAQARFGLGPAGYALLFLHWAAMDGVAIGPLAHLRGLASGLVAQAGVRRALEAHASPLLAMDLADGR